VAWVWLALVVVAWGLLRLAGDRWWPATLLTFGPRWVILLPLLILVPSALLFRRRALVPVAMAAILGAGPFMGLCLSWPGLAGAVPQEKVPIVRIVSYNAGEGGTSVDRVCDFISQARPDVIVFAEWKNAREELLPRLGRNWHAAENQTTALFSRFPIRQVEKLGPDRCRKPWRAPALRCELETPFGPIWVVGLHLDTPREGLDAVRKSFWRAGPEMELMAADRRHESELASELAHAAPGPVIIAGDFNMPVDSAIYRQYWSSWQNAFSTAGLGYGQTKFTRAFGARIDHVLANQKWQVLSARVGANMGGDHRPLQVDLQLR
jgi:endonuclease/exonuclease/phosphatase (EEP) superfamily protein YafD